MKNDQIFIAEKIVHYRKLKGITQEELAERTQVNVRTIQRIEAGEVDPRLYTLRVIAEALDISVEALTPPPPEKDRTNLALIHLSQLCVISIPLGNILGPLIYWLAKKEKVNKLDEHAKEILNAQISYTMYAMLLAMLLFLLKFHLEIPIPLLISIMIIFFGYLIGYPIINSVRVYKGKQYLPYVFKIKFLR
jgi:uncharacterized Tic20 family protein